MKGRDSVLLDNHETVINITLDILSPIQNLNGYSVLNSSQFANEVANMEISDDEVMVSFDVVSLFTTIPVNKACAYIRDKLNNDNTLHLRTSLNTDDIISLLEFILSNNYFVYNNCIYKQIHGCAMGSPDSPIVANLCVEVIEELAISTSSVPPIKKDAVSSFHNTLNASDPKISFTIELENNGQIAFLDTLVSRRNGVVRKTLESWHTAKTFDADNNSKPLPRQYSILL